MPTEQEAIARIEVARGNPEEFCTPPTQPFIVWRKLESEPTRS
jgi:hypothetical protein